MTSASPPIESVDSDYRYDRFTCRLLTEDLRFDDGADTHLSRLFRAATGHTIARHGMRLRARAVLDRLAGGGQQLARLAAASASPTRATSAA